MNYFLLSNSTNPLEIGYYLQADKYAEKYNPNSANGIWKINPNKISEFSPNIIMEINPKAKLTDNLSNIIGFGWLISPKLKEILKEYCLPKHAFYRTTVYKQHKPYEYYLLHYVITDFWDYLDAEASDAVIIDSKNNFEITSEINLSDTPDKIFEIRNSLPYNQQMIWKKIVFKNTFPKYDIYKTTEVQLLQLASEKLIDKLKSEEITGFEYSDRVKAMIL